MVAAVAVTALLAVSACSSTGETGATTSSTAGPVLPTADARREAVESQLLPSRSIDAATTPVALDRRMAELGVPGVSVAVIDDGAIDWAAGYGVTDAASGLAVDADTLFQATSISKPVTAIAALTLVDDGLVTLDGDVGEWLRSWQVPLTEHSAERPTTIRALTSHTAGTNVSGFVGYVPGTPIPDVVGVLEGRGNSAAITVDGPPGTFRYSGGGFVVLQALIEDVTGVDFAAAVADRVLTPLDMTVSTFAQPLPEPASTSAASAHDGDGQPLSVPWFVYPELAAAGLWTTPADLARFAIGLQEAYAGEPGGVVSRGLAREIVEGPDHAPANLGFFAAGDGPSTWVFHDGGNVGFRSTFVVDLAGDQGVVVMTNGDDGDLVADEIVNAVALVYGWKGWLTVADDARGDLDE